MRKGGLLLAALALAAYWPVLDAHPLMDDHLFFSWLEQTPWQTALWQRFSGNWIPYFTSNADVPAGVGSGAGSHLHALRGSSFAAPSLQLAVARAD